MNAKVERGIISRRTFLQQQYARTDGVLADPPPAVIITKQTLSPDLRIPVEDLKVPLEYTIPLPKAQAVGDILHPFIRRKGDPASEVELEPFIELDDDIAQREWPLPLFIPVSFLKEEDTPETPTEYEVRYIYWSGGTNPGNSVETTFAVDLTAPGKVKKPPADRTPGAPTWPLGLGPNDPIDDTFLGNHPNGVPVKTAAYANYHSSDYVKFFWGKAPDPARDVPAYEGQLPSTFEVLIPVEKFKNGEEGANSLIYIINDLPNNVGRRSNASTRSVVFLPNPDPNTVLPPVVPLASGVGGDDLLDLADSQLATVEVSVPTPNSPNDSIVVKWGSISIAPEKRVETNTLLSFDIDYDVIKAVYGNTDGEVDTNISYKMFRGNREIATNNRDIKVDISYIGPDPILIGLDAPRLVTTAGSTNTILEADFGDDAIKVFLDLFDDPPTEEGWLIDVFYDDIKVGETIPLTTGQEDTTLEVKLPWQTVLTQQSGTKVLRWVLYTLNGNNPTHSRTQDIVVEAFPIEMAAPEVLNLAGPMRRIGCPTLNFGASGDGEDRRNLQVRVLKNSHTVDGETITLTFEAFTPADPPVPVPNTKTTATLLITGTFPDEGALIFIGSYLTHFKPSHGANGHLTYSITRSGTTPTPESLPAVHPVHLTNSEVQFCEEVDPLPGP